jgi:sensor histidine kinase YesM
VQADSWVCFMVFWWFFDHETYGGNDHESKLLFGSVSLLFCWYCLHMFAHMLDFFFAQFIIYSSLLIHHVYISTCFLCVILSFLDCFVAQCLIFSSYCKSTMTIHDLEIYSCAQVYILLPNNCLRWPFICRTCVVLYHRFEHQLTLTPFPN